MENQQPEALRLAQELNAAICHLNMGFVADIDTYDLGKAALELESLYARNQELEGMLDSVGAGGVSAQRVTQAAGHIERDRFEAWWRENVSQGLADIDHDYRYWAIWQARAALDAKKPVDSLYNEKLYAELGSIALGFVDRAGDVHPGIDDAETICAEFYAAMCCVLDGKPKTAAAPVVLPEPAISDVLPAIGSRVFIRHGGDNDAHACIVTGYYAWEDDGGNPMLNRVFVRMVYEDTGKAQSCMLCECYPSAEAALAADHIAQDRKTVAAPVVLPEPAAVVDYYSQGGENDQISAFLPIGTKLYTEQQVRELLDKATCTKSQTTAQEPFGYFKAEPFGWRDCAETDEGAIALYEAPQPQADARDAQRYRWLRAQPLESDVFCITIWRKGTDGFGDDLRLEELDAAIDASIAAAKEI